MWVEETLGSELLEAVKHWVASPRVGDAERRLWLGVANIFGAEQVVAVWAHWRIGLPDNYAAWTGKENEIKKLALLSNDRKVQLEAVLWLGEFKKLSKLRPKA